MGDVLRSTCPKCLSVVCSSVCLFVCSHISKIACLNFNKFSAHVTCGRGSVILWRQCNMLCTSVFVDNVMFSHIGGQLAKIKHNIIFCRVRQMAAQGRSCYLRLQACLFLWRSSKLGRSRQYCRRENECWLQAQLHGRRKLVPDVWISAYIK